MFRAIPSDLRRWFHQNYLSYWSNPKYGGILDRLYLVQERFKFMSYDMKAKYFVKHGYTDLLLWLIEECIINDLDKLAILAVKYDRPEIFHRFQRYAMYPFHSGGLIQYIFHHERMDLLQFFLQQDQDIHELRYPLFVGDKLHEVIMVNGTVTRDIHDLNTIDRTEFSQIIRRNGESRDEVTGEMVAKLIEIDRLDLINIGGKSYYGFMQNRFYKSSGMICRKAFPFVADNTAERNKQSLLENILRNENLELRSNFRIELLWFLGADLADLVVM